MKKIQILIIFCLSILVGCTNGNEKNTTDQKNDGINWSKKRAKLFSTLDYPELSKTEAEKLMEEKFELEIPPFFERSLGAIQKNLRTENQVQYAIKSDAEILTIRGMLTTGMENTFSELSGVVDAQFQVNNQEKKVYLTRQSLVIQNNKMDSEIEWASIRVLLKELGEAMELPDVDEAIKKAEKKIAQLDDKDQEQLVEIYNDGAAAKKKQYASRTLTILCDGNNHYKEIYGLISLN